MAPYPKLLGPSAEDLSLRMVNRWPARLPGDGGHLLDTTRRGCGHQWPREVALAIGGQEVALCGQLPEGTHGSCGGSHLTWTLLTPLTLRPGVPAHPMSVNTAGAMSGKVRAGWVCPHGVYLNLTSPVSLFILTCPTWVCPALAPSPGSLCGHLVACHLLLDPICVSNN